MLQFEEVKQALTDLEPELRDLADALGLEKTKEEIEKLEQQAAAQADRRLTKPLRLSV